MKSKFVKISTVILTTLVVASSPITIHAATASTKSYKVNSVVSIPQLKLVKNTYVSDYKYADINGDKVKDNIILAGTKQKKSDNYFDNLNLIIQDGKTKKFTKASIAKDASGYNPTMFLGDFNGDKTSDVLISMPTGGSGGMESYSLISLKNNQAAYLLDQEKFNNGLEYNVQFKDGYKVDVDVKTVNKTYTLDISDMKDIYKELNIYNSNGKLLEPTNGMSNPLSGLEIVKTQKGDDYHLISYQRVIGTCNAETLGYVKGEWSLDGSIIKLVDVKVEKN